MALKAQFEITSLQSEVASLQCIMEGLANQLQAEEAYHSKYKVEGMTKYKVSRGFEKGLT